MDMEKPNGTVANEVDLYDVIVINKQLTQVMFIAVTAKKMRKSIQSSVLTIKN